MKTVRLPVIFGWGPDGARDGTVRIVVPDGMSASMLRHRVMRGTAALHGPQNRTDVGIHPYRLLFRGYKNNGWDVWGTVSTAD